MRNAESNLDTKVKVFHESVFFMKMFHEMPLKLYFMKCSDKKVSQCILACRNTLFVVSLFSTV